jgi:DNA-binding response OmpR family regulator
MFNNIVIIEDDQITNEMLVDIASYELKMQTKSFFTGEQFLSSFQSYPRCIYVIDANLPGEVSGRDLIKLIREKDKISPIFMISGDNTREKLLEGLKCGADDYLIKPFIIEELITKILNARKKFDDTYENLMNFGLKLIPEAGVIIKEGRKVTLTAREFQVFKVLYDAPGEVHSRSKIITMFNDYETTERNIDVLVYGLRKKLDVLGMEVSTIRGQGYQLRPQGQGT